MTCTQGCFLVQGTEMRSRTVKTEEKNPRPQMQKSFFASETL